ncbi:gamma-glutamylcyclotransferase family protein [Roseovarius sp. EL26]|uniref:gamma-glutamylcyclotransferase family protein n=1 Tax=Roseovarius sp. EL26 TaxID=2126672 RepID=UPI000EA37A09|nr:gamma-glutamylcyclotransferase family protein [Roseovarius sp. EL26]
MTSAPTQPAYFFGYGSLVNRHTHHFDPTHPAQLQGWRRVWRHTALRPVAYLTVQPAPGHEIDGLIAPVPGADWAALDERERAYDRITATAHTDHDLDHVPDIAVYTIPEGKHGKPTAQTPVLLSYLDVVVQGYLNEFGEPGVTRFFETTDGWDAPILNDRTRPIYPRHLELNKKERALTDAFLKSLDVQIIPAEDPQARHLWPDP